MVMVDCYVLDKGTTIKDNISSALAHPELLLLYQGRISVDLRGNYCIIVLYSCTIVGLCWIVVDSA